MTYKQIFFSFRGRLNRQRYWLATLAYSIVLVVLQIALMASISQHPEAKPFAPMVFGFFIIWFIFMWMMLAISIKRIHDLDKSGWFLLLMFIPLIGPLLMLIVLGFIKGTAGDNKYGADLVPSANPAPTSRKKTALIVIAIVIGLILLGSGAFYGLVKFIKGNESYTTAESYLRNDEQIKAAVGEVSGFGFMPVGGFNIQDGQGTASYFINVIGNKGEVKAVVSLSKEMGQPWKVDSMEINSGGSMPEASPQPPEPRQ